MSFYPTNIPSSNQHKTLLNNYLLTHE